MDFSWFNDIADVFSGIFSFLFTTFEGIGILIGSCLIICFIAAFILERKTRKELVDHGLDQDKENDNDE